MQEQDPHQGKPWYKHPHVWLLITFPVLAILGGIHMLYLVSTSTDSLVSNSYYKEGNQINQRLALDKATAAQGVSAQIMLGDDLKSVRLIVNKAPAGAITLKLSHPTQSARDQEITLSAQNGMYAGSLKQPIDQGRWYVELSDEKNSWLLRKDWRVASSDSLNLP